MNSITLPFTLRQHLTSLLLVVSHEKSEFGVEWMRFEADAAAPDLVRQVPHVAFEVADLASELAGREIRATTARLLQLRILHLRLLRDGMSGRRFQKAKDYR